MAHHTAFRRPPEDLDVIIVEDSKPMQTVLRSILMPLRFARTRVFDSADVALQAMLNEPPSLLITDWRMRPTSGFQLLRAIRHEQMAPLCYVPVIFVTAHATRPLVEKAMRAGAHHLLAKPVSPARMHECIAWVIRDSRELHAAEDGSVGIEGVREAFDAQHERMKTINRAKAFHQHMERRSTELQGQVDQIMDNHVVGSEPVTATSAAKAKMQAKPVLRSRRAGEAGEFAAVKRRFG
ncbi:two-component system chemotaxis response regulator CheY [Rhodobium orientis]|uniref:Response regulatory domain-containing protein n=1 Tax=Rhodobium orientis TaxID=34017 RepID=A0A327JGJ9_9HYPH|nr:response regulator [Rhodobium orientis]MBB4302646.1 two-component system chemotaxis response regulator CheY [Rhodobium orientis]MBK5951484.1 hypothetical protein [Rhodobium orientis]RAI24109.1 hypothetical protein CH339_22795 [Rhodobium orientis]